MTVPIAVPATAQAALDAGVMYVLCVSLTLPAAQSADGAGAPWLWTNAHKNVEYQSRNYLANKTVRSTEFPTSARNAEGRVALTLYDPDRLWEQRMRSAGVRGKAVELLYLLPHGNKLWWPMQTFRGNTESVEPVNDRRDGNVLRLLVEDAVYAAKEARGEYTTDGYQKMLSSQAGQTPHDNSHAIAAIVRQIRWHTR